MSAELESRVAFVRSFNRFYTRKIGVLDEHILKSDFSLAELRVLYELAHCDKRSAAEISEALSLDPGYLSRILRSFEDRQLIRRRASAEDGRRSTLELTRRGKSQFAQAERRSAGQVEEMLNALTPADQDRLIEAMQRIERLLASRRDDAGPYLLRTTLRSGDMGRVVARHGEIYAAERGWDERFEGMVARIVSDFIERFDPKRERCWIAERDGENVGSVFLVKHPDEPGVAKLRLLFVEPKARGLGIGRRLVAECTRFARDAGYRTITLWTQSILASARYLYQQEGYRLVSEEPHHSFGHDLVGETWELVIRNC